MKTIYKANGITFKSFEDVEAYANSNNFIITNTESFVYKNTTVVCVNFKSA